MTDRQRRLVTKSVSCFFSWPAPTDRRKQIIKFSSSSYRTGNCVRLTAGRDCGISDIGEKTTDEKSKINIRSILVLPHFPAFRDSRKELPSVHALESVCKSKSARPDTSTVKNRHRQQKKKNNSWRARPVLERAMRSNYMRWRNQSIVTRSIDFYCVYRYVRSNE